VILRRLDDLSQNAAGVFGVGESYKRTTYADPRLLVDQLNSCGAEPSKLALNVADLVGDVMHPRAIAFKEAADWSVGAERLEQFDVVLAKVEQNGLNSLLLNDLAVNEFHLERALIELQGRVDCFNGDANVVDAIKHSSAQSTKPSRAAPARSR
jgi:hypothetical protein